MRFPKAEPSVTRRRLILVAAKRSVQLPQSCPTAASLLGAAAAVDDDEVTIPTCAG